MMKYRIISKRKHFYACPHCAIVFICAKALNAHHQEQHPDLPPIEVEELAPDPLEDDAFEELNMNNNFLYKEDLYTISKPVQLISSEPSSIVTNIIANHALEEVEYVSNPHLTSTKLITLTAPIEPTITPQIPIHQVNNAPTVYSIQVNPSISMFHQNGQIAKKSTVFMEPTPIMTSISVQPPPPPAAPSEKPEKKYSCDPCNKFFSTIYNKRRHDDMFHNNNTLSTNEFKCSSCEKVFTSIYNKTRHENVHKPINERLKFKCIINNCNRGFTTQFILKMHIKKVHNMDVNF